MLNILSLILPFFLIILLGFVLVKIKYISPSWEKALNGYALKIGFPVLLFSVLSTSSFDFSSNLALFLANFGLLLGLIIILYLSKLIIPWEKKVFNTFVLCAGFGNVAFLGLPLLSRIFGVEALPEGSIIVAIYLIFLLSLPLFLIEYNNQQKLNFSLLLNFFKTPLILSIILGIIFSYLNFSLPAVTTTVISMISASVTPVVLLLIGISATRVQLSTKKEWLQALILSAVLLIVTPLLFYLLIIHTPLPLAKLKFSLFFASLPIAIVPFALADKYNLDKDLISLTIILSTFLSLITIPFWVFILQNI